jgi:hypothetical protein
VPGLFVEPVYKALVKGGFGAYIPFDNQQKILGESAS